MPRIGAKRMRELVFVSHANPEDNDFALWLTLHLAREGYPVWLEKRRLLGGEDFWAEVEQTIRERAVKVLFVLSRASNMKQGTKKELALSDTIKRGHNFKDFIIPLAIDDLPPADHNIYLHQLHVIPFYRNWADGFRQLLGKLSEDGVAKDPSYNNDTVTSWWRDQYSPESGVVAATEKYYSNWYQILSPPAKLYCYDGQPRSDYRTNPLHWPSHQLGKRFITFAAPDYFKHNLDIRFTRDFVTRDVLQGIVDERFIPKSEAKKIVNYLLVDNWVRMMHQRQMMVYRLSNHKFCGALREGQVKDDKVFYDGTDGKPAWRGLVGFKTLGRLDSEKRLRKWHFGLQAKAQFWPIQAYVITHHVVFSDDGKTPWTDRGRQHKARRNQCRSWWNDDWRDRSLALMNWFAEGSDQVTVDCGGSAISVSSVPMVFSSPVSFVGEGDTSSNDLDEREAKSDITVGFDDSDDDEHEEAE